MFIQVNNLNKSFHNEPVLKNIHVSIGEGETVAIIGPSGAGKSTFLRTLNGLEKPTSGEIIIDGMAVTSPDTDLQKVREKVGMVFQQFNLFKHMTVIDNVAYGLIRVKNVPKEEARSRALTYLDRVGLKDKANRYPHELSGGEKQRVAIARTLAVEPKVILFDEPTSSLDPEMVKEVLVVMKSLAQAGYTILVVTHEMGFARYVANRILFMVEGEIIEDTTPDVFFTQPQTERAKAFLDQILDRYL